jgi:acetyl esterase/lipase
MLKHFWLCTLLLTGFSSFAQLAPKDTSFTPYSAYVKSKKTYPFISIALPVMPADVVMETATFCAVGERTLKLDVYHPLKTTQRALPAVLLVFGGGWRSGERAHNDALAKGLAAKGFIAVSADYRLSTEALYPAPVHDLKAAVRWMRANAKKYGIDKDKIAVMGCSAGGQLAMLLGTTNNDPKFEGSLCHRKQSSTVQAVVDVDGVLAFIHPESGEGNETKGPSAATLWFGGTKEQKTDLWNEASPLNHVGKTTPPVLFINSSVARMHAGRDDMRKRMDALHIYSEVQSFPDAPHPFWLFNPWYQPTVGFAANFLNKVFKVNKQ